MNNILLIDRAEIAKYKQISKSVNNDVLNMHIREAQENDLKPLIGERLYNTVLANLANYTDLLNGSMYEIGGNIYRNYGVKPVLVYYTVARYSMFGDVTDTPFSMVNKLNGQESSPISFQTKKAIYTENQKIAYNMFLTVDAFLRRTNNTLYLQSCSRKNNAGFSFSKIV